MKSVSFFSRVCTAAAWVAFASTTVLADGPSLLDPQAIPFAPAEAPAVVIPLRPTVDVEEEVEAEAEPAPMLEVPRIANIPEYDDSLPKVDSVPKPDTVDEPAIQPVPEVDDAGREVVRQRFPNGKVAMQRSVTQDASGNYVNHGPCELFDAEGRALGGGEYLNGRREGGWTRTYYKGVGFEGEQYEDFTRPFTSQVPYSNGLLNGEWLMTDADGRIMHQFPLVNGRLHGVAVLWYPNGQKRAEETYQAGVVDGESREWAEDGDVREKIVYLKGRRMQAPEVRMVKGKKYSKGAYLLPKKKVIRINDWWTAAITESETGEGQPAKHGEWTWWYDNGKKRSEGEYVDNRPHGMHRAWHENGNPSLVGEFDKGTPLGKHEKWYANGQVAMRGEFITGRRNGVWTWWYDSGQKQRQLQYFNGQPFGLAQAWNEDGRIVENMRYNDAPVYTGGPNGGQMTTYPDGATTAVGVPVQLTDPARPQTTLRGLQIRQN